MTKLDLCGGVSRLPSWNNIESWHNTSWCDVRFLIRGLQRHLDAISGGRSRRTTDWIQGYMYSLGCQGLRVSNSPVSSWCDIDFPDMSASHCLGISAWELQQWAPSSLAWATAALARKTTPRIIPIKKIYWYMNTVTEGYKYRKM